MNVVVPASTYKRNRSAYLTARREGLGASDTAAVLGLDPWRTPLDVYLDKVSGVERETGEAAEWGSAIEAVVARKVSTRHPGLGVLQPSPGICAHPDHNWLRATPDRLLNPRGAGPVAILEIKTTDARNKPDWATEPPLRVQVQVQQQLAVLGLDVAYVAVLFSGREMPPPYRIERDPHAIDLIVEHAGKFWHDNVLAQVPPEARAGDNLADLWPGDDTLDALIANDDLEEWFTYRRRLIQERKSVDERLEMTDRQIKEAMGDRTLVIDGLGRVLATWKPVTSTRLDSKRLKADHPDLASQYATTTSTRTFRVKETTDD